MIVMKTNSCTMLSKNTLNSLIRIRMEGSTVSDYDPTQPIKVWVSTANIDHTKKKGKRLRPQDAVKRSKVLVNDSSTDISATEYDDAAVVDPKV